MWPDEVKEEHEHGDEVVGRIEGTKALLGLVPRLKLLVKSLYEVVRDIVLERLNADMLDAKRVDRLLVGSIAIRNNGCGSSGQRDNLFE